MVSFASLNTTKNNSNLYMLKTRTLNIYNAEISDSLGKRWHYESLKNIKYKIERKNSKFVWKYISSQVKYKVKQKYNRNV